MTEPESTTLTLEKTTKNTYRYAEDGDDVPLFGTLYVKKYVFGDEPPRTIEVQLRAVEGAPAP